MNTPDNYFVEAILKNEVTIYCTLKEKVVFLKVIGAKRDWFWKKTWSLSFESKKEMINILMKLNESGAAFSFDEHGWGPSSVFIHYRDEGLVQGEIVEIFWIGGGKYRTRKR